jgi:hypothetical protein
MVEQKSKKSTKPATASELPSPTDILKEAWGLYLQQFKTILGVYFGGLFCIIAGVILFVVIGVLGGIFMGSKSLGFIALIVILFSALVAALIVFSVWFHVALVTAIIHARKRIGIIESYRSSWKFIASYWWMQLLAGLIVFAGIVLFIIPGIVLSYVLCFSTFILLVEDTKGLNALIKSREYFCDRFWSIVGRLLFMSIPFIILPFVPLFYPRDMDHGGLQLIVTALQLFLTPLSLIFSYVLYEKVKAAKRKFDFVPMKNQRILYSALAIVGALIPILFILGMMFMVVPRMNRYNSSAQDQWRGPAPTLRYPKKHLPELQSPPSGYRTTNQV